MSSNLNYKQTANVERRTWDREKYEAKARARSAEDGGKSAKSTKIPRVQADSGKPTTVLEQLAKQSDEELEEFLPAEEGRAGPELSKRAFLKSRSKRVALEAKVGSTEIVSHPVPQKKEGVTSLSVRYFEIGLHRIITFQIFNRLFCQSGVDKSPTGVGWFCKVCDCVLKDSLTYLDHINGKKHQRHLGYTMRAEKSTVDEVKSTLQELAKQKEIEKKQSLSKEIKLKTEPVSYIEKVKAKEEELLDRKFERERKREERRKKIAKEQEEAEEEEQEEAEIDPDLAAMMGFTSFGK